jgi:hypothetical protein
MGITIRSQILLGIIIPGKLLRLPNNTGIPPIESKVDYTEISDRQHHVSFYF